MVFGNQPVLPLLRCETSVYRRPPKKVSSMATLKRSRRQVCLFGTSANPPTGDSGHRGIVQALSKLEHLDEVRVLPVYQHTFSSKRNQLLSYNHRIEMCKLAFEGIPKVVVSDAEQRSFLRKAQTVSDEARASLRVGTAELLEMLQEEEPETDFSFCLGADTFLDLTAWKWRRSKDVLSLLNGRLVVLHRKGVTGTDDLKDRINQVNREEGRGNIAMLDLETLGDVSSSLVRSMTSEEELHSHLTVSLVEYIKANRFYAFGEKGNR